MDAPAAANKPSPATMLRVSEQFDTVLADHNRAAAIQDDIALAADYARNSMEMLVAANFDNSSADNRVVTLLLSERLDALLGHLNRLNQHLYLMERNANDFYTLAIDVELSHRKASEPLRPRGQPLNIDIRQTANGADTIIEDDDANTADLLLSTVF